MISGECGKISDKDQENTHLFWRSYQEAVLCVLREKSLLTEGEYEACLKLLFDRQSAMRQGRDD